MVWRAVFFYGQFQTGRALIKKRAVGCGPFGYFKLKMIRQRPDREVQASEYCFDLGRSCVRADGLRQR